MDEHIILLCTLEHLRARDTTTEWAFGLNLSVAVSDQITNLNDKVLQPWTWLHITEVMVYIQDGTATLPVRVTITRQMWNGTEINDTNFATERRQLKESLDTDYAVSKPIPGALKWSPALQRLSVSSKLRAERPWHTLVGKVSLYPAPFPQILNLSFTFTVTKRNMPGVQKFAFAAPIIKNGDPFPSEMVPAVTPAVLMLPDQGGTPVPHGGIYTWTYAPEVMAGVPLKAYMAKCEIRETATPTGTFLDLDSLWVDKLRSSEPDHFEEDWRAVLEDRMADAFDLGQRVIEYLRANAANDVTLPAIKEQLALYQEMVIASLRDLAGSGVKPGPNGLSLLNRLLAIRGLAPLTTAQTQALIAASESKFNTLELWMGFLRKSLPQLTQLSIINKDPDSRLRERLTVKETIAELEQLHQIVLDENNLATLVQRHWREIFTAVPSLLEELERFNFSSLSLRHMLALENIGVFWGHFVDPRAASTGSGHELINRNLSCFFQAYFCWRFNVQLRIIDNACSNLNSITISYMPPLSVPTSIRDQMIAYIANWCGQFVKKLLPPPSGMLPAGENPEPSDVPHAVTLQVDTLSALPNETANDSGDMLSRISGVGILMREQPADPNASNWLCLNFAASRGRTHDIDTVLFNGVLVPSSLNYQNNLRQAFVTYNNHPLVAQSPVSDARMTPVSMQTANTLNDPTPLVRYRYPIPASADDRKAKLPALKFGKSYEVLPFIITNSGALPKELAPDSAIEPRLDTFTSQTLRSKVRSFTYLRKVRVGQLRVFDNKNADPLKIPEIPTGVYPRARDMVLEPRGGATATAQSPHKEQPIVLLAPQRWIKPGAAAQSEFKFKLRMPATDLNTWDRWVAFDNTARPLRKAVWADFYRRSETNRMGKTSLDTKLANRADIEDVTIDDPCLDKLFYVKLLRCTGAANESVNDLWVPVQPSADASRPISVVQSLPVPFECRISEDSGANPPGARLTGGVVSVVAAEGEVYRLLVYSCLPESDYRSRFANVIPDTAQIENRVTNPNNGRVYFLISPFSLIIEAATGKLIEVIGAVDDARLRNHLHTGLTPQFSAGEKPGSIVVALKPASESTVRDGFRYLHRVELLRQVWRWQGRETSAHPGIYTDAGSISDWEAWEFGNRSNTDHLVIEMVSQPPSNQGSRNFTFEEVLEGRRVNPAGTFTQGAQTFTYQQVLQGVTVNKSQPFIQDGEAFTYDEILVGGKNLNELRALHYRFAARVFSRYAGIMPPIEMMSETRDTTGNIWKSLFIPCRKREPIQSPKVKLILPLTESFAETSSVTGRPSAANQPAVPTTAGLLVVLDEPWYEIGGLGEGIRAEIEVAANPEDDPQHPTRFYFEVGPDPLKASADRGLFRTTGSTGAGSDQVCFGERIRGPIGHTFDRTNDSPLFTATSFILPPPTIIRTGSSTQTTDFSWGFCKLRLQRIIALRATANGGGCETPEPSSRLQSPFTEAFWVQFLPEFSLFISDEQKEKGVTFKDLRLKFQSNRELLVTDRKGNVSTLNPGSSLTHIFEIYLVVTLRVFDVTGKPDQESYVGVFHQVNNSWITEDRINITRDSERRLRARVIEVQRRPAKPPDPPNQPYPSGEALWNALFAPNIADHQRARIVRISEPIESFSAIASEC